jgi:hypothetical protein
MPSCLVVSALAETRAEREGVVVAAHRWNDLSPRTRRLLIAGASAEGTMKVAALIDLSRRPASEVRGSKARWAVAIILINSVGAVPVAYFARGRRR